MTIVLYDIANLQPGPRTASSNVWKARMSLNYKGLDYRTEWVESIEIGATLKKLGAPPTGKKPDGSDHYTLPAIYDPKTDRYISDSWSIAEYLDTTYPEKPLFPQGTTGAIALFQSQFINLYINRIYPTVQLGIYKSITPRSCENFRKIREMKLGKTLEELCPPGPTRDGAFQNVKEGLDVLARCLEKNGKDTIFYLGNAPSYADFIMVAFFLWTRVALSDEEWEKIASWNGGRWDRLIKETEEWQKIQ